MNIGGNMDNRRITKGAKLFLTVANAGALLTMGDAHTAQGEGFVCPGGIWFDEPPRWLELHDGMRVSLSLWCSGDSEFDGTGIETHINGKFKLTLHKVGSSTFPKKVTNLAFPLIENEENFIIQASYPRMVKN